MSGAECCGRPVDVSLEAVKKFDKILGECTYLYKNFCSQSGLTGHIVKPYDIVNCCGVEFE